MSTPDVTIDPGGGSLSDGHRPSDRIVTALAEEKGVDVLDVDPLFDTIDLDAVDDLLGGGSGTADSSVRLSFVVQGCRVVASGDGSVTVRSLEGSTGNGR
ncbi:HalOD1 output domain-containing protein [Natranaeroarchaeum aerophilus]|uniref:Halobacterial output domain-containing protein n=1 Tax=Natranaeroarchaeum aerophilus TaxID=2917711 RepID=A0AAE3FS68_9EURY|nr:HalOD1 output domain-containing protein [Natranaeroarchaeum aerophilus]MCL9814607.1 hypothetical protein [Natranaeroarchaeum aerophilus]